MEINKTIDYFYKKRTRMFWVFQIAFWFMHWSSSLLTSPDNQNFLFLHTLYHIDGIMITYILRIIYTRLNCISLSWLKLIPLIIICSLVSGLSWWFLSSLNSVLYFYILYGKMQTIGFKNFTMFMQISWYMSYPFLAWSAIYFGYKFWEEWNNQKLKVEQEKALLKAAQLEMLQYQLNPHFLFNTLSSLRALIRINPEKAEQMITHISEFLRYSLLEGQRGQVPLSKEIEIMHQYLDIEKIRFKEKLLIDYDIDEMAENYPIPVFLVHPLIENAIKHGMETSKPPLKICMKAFVNDGKLTIEVANTGHWIEKNQDNEKNNTGTGLKNTRKRLELAYPEFHKFEIIKESNLVTIRMEIKKNPEKNHVK